MTVNAICYDDKPQIRKRLKKSFGKVCSAKMIKRKLPIVGWLPKYNVNTLVQDMIAGITVGLTAIPQGLAYAIIAGLSPEYGLYSGLVAGVVYTFFGSCKDITVGPTAIMAAIVAKFVAYSSDFAILASFLAGIVELLMGVLNFGFLVEFISGPVISGFTTAAVLQIASSQLKGLFGLRGSAGTYFAESAVSFVRNIKTTTLWDPILGFSTIVILLLLKKLGRGCSITGGVSEKIRCYVSLSRNAIVVVIGMLVAFIVKRTTGDEPVVLIGDIVKGLPTPKLPPFSTTVGNDSYIFGDMLQVFGPSSFVLPFVAILEAVAVAKSFADGVQVDANQEMIALGLCNIVSSFVSSMPTTGSFTKSALNRASGVKTPAGGIFNCLLIVLSVTLLASTFYYVPKASLAGLIITAMMSMVDYEIFGRLWVHSKRELCVLIVTIIMCLGVGLEYGIVTGILLDALFILYSKARPTVYVYSQKEPRADLVVITLNYNLSYCAAEHVRKSILVAAEGISSDSLIIIDGTNLRKIDSTIASTLATVANDVNNKICPCLFLNFDEKLSKMCTALKPQLADKFFCCKKLSDVADMYFKGV
ncbi:unnamed protein product [Leptosia nina]|uniref:STAS domain-containing protein n=1 Tax=Leptosia nina TaxID=320188 RepID=A0AAV1JSW6_9NEOP